MTGDSVVNKIGGPPPARDSGGDFFASYSGIASSALSLVSANVKNPKARNAIMAATLVASVAKAVKEKLDERKSERSYIIKISSSDVLYDKVMHAMVESIPDADQRNVLAFSAYSSRDSYGSPDGPRTIRMAYDGERSQDVTLAGHKVSILVETTPGSKGSESNMLNRYVKIECPTMKARDSIITYLGEMAKNISKDNPSFMTATKWGDFKRTTVIPRRPIDTVILKDGQSDRILSDLKTFLTQEEQYVSLGIPYHRGVLFYGDPGTGKTSIASSIAYELGVDVYYIALSSIENDATLTDLLSYVKDRSVLLLEDIDVAHASKDRGDESGGVTLSGLLNALDGFATPHGLITILTTNHIEVLDPALIRPGRVDIMEEINAVDSYQVEELCKQFLGYVPQGLPRVEVSDNIVAAEVVEVFKRHLSAPAEAEAEIVAMLVEKVSGSRNVPKAAQNGQSRKEV